MVTLFSDGGEKSVMLAAKLKAAGIPFTIVTDVDAITAYGFVFLPVLFTRSTHRTFGFEEALQWIKNQTGRE